MKIYFINGVMAGESVELYKPEITLGRETDNDVSILTAGVSRYHARIARGSDGKWSVADRNSTNGVKVNNIPVDGNRTLEEGDIINLGDQTIRFGEKKDMQAEIASAFLPTPAPVLQPAQTKVELPAPKVVFEPIALPDGGLEAPKIVLNEVTPAPAGPKIELHELKPDAGALNPDQPIFQGKASAAAEKTITAARALSFIEDKTEAAREHISEAILKGKINIFTSKEQIARQAGGEAGKSPRRFSNLLFYTIVICSAAVFVCLFIAFQESAKVKPAVKSEKKSAQAPFLVYYEKDKATPDNLFRFAMRLEGGKAYFTIDDLKAQRRYAKTIDKINPALLGALKKEIEGTTFMSLPPPSASEALRDGVNDVRTLIVSYDDRINGITVRNSYAPGAFETIENAISDFAGNFGLQTIALSPEELKQRAEELYQKAEDWYQNREAKPDKLLNAIARYQMAVEYLDQFSPKPATWEKARKRAAEAEAMLNKMRDDLKFEYQRLIQLDEYEKARSVTAQLMELYPPDSKDYEKYRTINMQLDKGIKERNKR